MKKIVFVVVLTLLFAEAKPIKLTPQQQRDWQIASGKPEIAKSLIVGEFMAEVTTPPQYLYSVTLPFEAQIKRLYVATYDTIKKGQLLAEVTGRDWIEIQQRFISDAIELKHHAHIAERKNRLCKEGIIPKKECTSANAEHRADKIKASASKALLRGYGATDKMINNLFEKLKISRSIKLRSSVKGKLLHLNVQSGKSTNPTDALFVIQKDGALWLEVEIPLKKAMGLNRGDELSITFNNENFFSKILLKSPNINISNQTQKVRFLLPNSSKFLTGIRDIAKLSRTANSLKVKKESIITIKNKQIVFTIADNGYSPIAVTILGEDKEYYYITGELKSSDTIATSSLAILKSLMEGDSE